MKLNVKTITQENKMKKWKELQVESQVYDIPKHKGYTKTSIIEKIIKVESSLTTPCAKENIPADPEYRHIYFYLKQPELINLICTLERMIVNGDMDVRMQTASNIKRFQAFMKEYESEFKDLLEKYKAIEEHNNNERIKLDNRSERLEKITKGCDCIKIIEEINKEVEVKNLAPVRWKTKLKVEWSDEVKKQIELMRKKKNKV